MRKTIRLLDEEGKFSRFIDPQERLTLLCPIDGQHGRAAAEKVIREDGTTDGTIKMCKWAPEECTSGDGYGGDSPTSLTLGDMLRNAAGVVDTPKRHQVYRLREKGKDGTGIRPENVPASIRCYGRGKDDKPNPELVGNTVDRSMSRVEQWPAASETNRTVTVVPGGVVGLTIMEPKELAALSTFSL